MSNRYTGLKKSQTEALHKQIRSEYLGYSSSQIDEEYLLLKARYEELRVYVDSTKESQRERKALSSALRSADSKIRSSKSRAISGMSTLKAIGTLFSSNPHYSEEHSNAVADARAARDAYIAFNPSSYTEEVAERKRIYHKLKVLSAIRREHKEKRTRALANAKMGKVRAATSSLKRRALKFQEGTLIECPYCTESMVRQDMVLDHIYPVAEGGLDTEKNTVLVCWKCNSKKSDLTLRAFAKKMRLDYEELCERLDAMGKKV